MLEPNLVFRLVAFMSLISSCFTSIVQSACNRGCDLALGSYYTGPSNDVFSIAEYINTDASKILKYNQDTIPNVQSFVRINVPFSCDCIDGEFLGHVFNYDLTSGDTYETIAQQSYSNLTTADWIQRFNTYDSDRLPDTGNVNVTVNCSCGNRKISKDYGLFLTYPLWPEETLDSISSAANLSSELIRSYNPDATFSQGSGLIYIPWRG
ncbi:putative non-specific serine/threonine protein kinase [Helianthus annuus]|uniref:Non-specific serine/threonine protein kinase n=2 Tax=Helianthus annuus TaxID=4232 RepID=A0A9K3I468_HELAN|nr:putative non-specific serine/threonine protein kinase [Helianthus annuus]KAJ0532920.1 putative non-specific serine/threonine protein kinase [Helianthus annuus]KAJ0891889.1 putative non-specific serine/threonine protein kinase [Helianthus annuus]